MIDSDVDRLNATIEETDQEYDDYQWGLLVGKPGDFPPMPFVTTGYGHHFRPFLYKYRLHDRGFYPISDQHALMMACMIGLDRDMWSVEERERLMQTVGLRYERTYGD